MTWHDASISECPGCGATIIVGIMSLAATCPYDGYYYVDLECYQGWYSSERSFIDGKDRVK